MWNKLAMAAVVALASADAQAGALYDQLSGREPRRVLYALFEKTAFDRADVQDLDRLWLDYGFTEETVVATYEHYRRTHPELQHAYQEVILWHTELDVVPAATTGDVFAALAQLFHEKASLFNGTVRMIGGFLDEETPNRKGICRWIAPNTFVMLYVVREAREPYLGPHFPMDGGTRVWQVMN